MQELRKVEELKKAFEIVKRATRLVNANADTHDAIRDSLDKIEKALFVVPNKEE